MVRWVKHRQQQQSRRSLDRPIILIERENNQQGLLHAEERKRSSAMPGVPLHLPPQLVAAAEENTLPEDEAFAGHTAAVDVAAEAGVVSFVADTGERALSSERRLMR